MAVRRADKALTNRVDATFPRGDDLMVKRIFALLAVFVLSIYATVVPAQTMQSLGEQLHVYLITLGPGADPWEKFGHDFIEIDDPSGMLTNYSDGKGNPLRQVSYNWGVFDFSGGVVPFGWHFLQGRLNYSMRAEPSRSVIDGYTHDGRYILKQELNLTADQKLGLLTRLQENDTDEHRYYLYDYFTRNCSTMARDAIDQTVNGRVQMALSQIPSGTTYRQEDRRCTADDLWLYVFLDDALGHPIDRPLTAWQESFLPEKLAGHLRDVKVPDAAGNMVPLIMSEEVLCKGTFPERTSPPSYFWGFFGTGLGLGGLLYGLARLGQKYWPARWVFNLFGMVWSLLVGLLGLLLTYAWFSNHDAAKWNENWFVGNVLSLLLVFLIPARWWWPRAALRVAAVVLGLTLFELVMKITPWFSQLNGQLIAAALPIHAGIAWGIWKMNTAKRLAMDPVVAKSTESANAS